MTTRPTADSFSLNPDFMAGSTRVLEGSSLNHTRQDHSHSNNLHSNSTVRLSRQNPISTSTTQPVPPGSSSSLFLFRGRNVSPDSYPDSNEILSTSLRESDLRKYGGSPTTTDEHVILIPRIPTNFPNAGHHSPTSTTNQAQ